MDRQVGGWGSDDGGLLKKILILGAIICGLVLAIFGVRHVLTLKLRKVYFDPQFQAYNPSIEKHFSQFLQDLEVVSQLDPFLPGDHVSDAGPYLNIRIPWMGECQKREPLDRFLAQIPPDIERIELPPAIADPWNDIDPGEWLSNVHAFDYALLDFAWLSHCLAYDYWDIETNAPVEVTMALFPDSPEKWFTVVNKPDWPRLFVWIKLRLMKGVVERDLLPALQETRHFARLLLTNESPMSSRAALRLLQFEKEAHDHYLKLEPAISGKWHPLSEDDLAEARRVLRGYEVLVCLYTDRRFTEALTHHPQSWSPLFRAEP